MQITSKKAAIEKLNSGKRGIWKRADRLNIKQEVIDELIEEGLVIERIQNNNLCYRYTMKVSKVQNKHSKSLLESLVS